MMPLCGRKFNGSGCIGSRWSSFLDLSHVRIIRHTETREPKHTPTLRRAFKLDLQYDKDGGIEPGEGWCAVVGSVYLPGTSGTGGSYFFFTFFPCLLLVSSLASFTKCARLPCPHALAICLSGFPQLLGGILMLELQADKFGAKWLKKAS